MGFLNTVTQMLGDGILSFKQKLLSGKSGINVLMLSLLDPVCLSVFLYFFFKTYLLIYLFNVFLQAKDFFCPT